MKLLLVIGTRPEAIKMMPVYKALAARDGVEVKLVLTGQHREMVRAILVCCQCVMVWREWHY